MSKITIQIDITTCKDYKIPVDNFEKALRDEFAKNELYLMSAPAQGNSLNGIGILIVESEGDIDYDTVAERITGIFMNLLEKYNDTSTVNRHKFLHGIQ
jgi:hypothetical protein